MKTDLTPAQIQRYRDNGFVVQENFLSPAELQEWREAVDDAVSARVKRIAVLGNASMCGARIHLLP
jgi:hypothetical protein